MVWITMCLCVGNKQNKYLISSITFITVPSWPRATVLSQPNSFLYMQWQFVHTLLKFREISMSTSGNFQGWLPERQDQNNQKNTGDINRRCIKGQQAIKSNKNRSNHSRGQIFIFTKCSNLNQLKWWITKGSRIIVLAHTPSSKEKGGMISLSWEYNLRITIVPRKICVYILQSLTNRNT